MEGAARRFAFVLHATMGLSTYAVLAYGFMVDCSHWELLEECQDVIRMSGHEDGDEHGNVFVHGRNS
jgi:hypothetical protein